MKKNKEHDCFLKADSSKNKNVTASLEASSPLHSLGLCLIPTENVGSKQNPQTLAKMIWTLLHLFVTNKLLKTCFKMNHEINMRTKSTGEKIPCCIYNLACRYDVTENATLLLSQQTFLIISHE